MQAKSSTNQVLQINNQQINYASQQAVPLFGTCCLNTCSSFHLLCSFLGSNFTFVGAAVVATSRISKLLTCGVLGGSWLGWLNSSSQRAYIPLMSWRGELESLSSMPSANCAGNAIGVSSALAIAYPARLRVLGAFTVVREAGAAWVGGAACVGSLR